jgi:O-antigen/teichoic acid export membrane protein
LATLLKRLKENALGSHQRTRKASKNIILSFLLKGYAMIIQFALVPFTLGYLDKFNYGIWLILVSVFEWFSYFDIGVGHGLRNKLAEALAKDDVPLSRTLVSTAYALISIIFISITILFALASPFINWTAVLNTPAEAVLHLSEMIFFVFAFFCLRFILSLITPILYAKQEPGINSIMGPLGSTLSFVGIILLAQVVKGSLFWASMIFSVVPALVMLTFSVVLFSTRYKTIAPSFKLVDFRYSKDLLGLGVNFFIIQISMLILFSTASLIITQFFGPEAVTDYNIAHKYFTSAILINGIITLTYWSPFTEAFVKKDFGWIKTSIRRLNMMGAMLIAGVIVSYFLSDFLIAWWVGKSIVISTTMKITLCVLVIIQVAASPYNIFINGASKVRLQLYVSIISIIITIPLSFLFCRRLDFGPSGVVMAMICSTLPGAILWRIQSQKLINGTATGIWDK